MKENGFTLIELLAIIVILAIIAVITIPKITKITEKSRKDSASLSANGYIEAVEKYVMIQSQNDDEFEMEGEFTILDGVLSQDSESYAINVNGTIPSNGYINLFEGDVISGCITMGKYKVTIVDGKILNTSKGNCMDFYTITFNSNGGSFVASIRTLGDTAITKPVNPTKADTKFLGWYTDEELINKFDFSSGVSEDTTLYAKWGEPSLATDSWSEIKENLRDDSSFYTLGSEKTISMNLDGEEKQYIIRLVNTSTPEVCSSSSYSQTACGVVFEFVTSLGTYTMETTADSDHGNYGGWELSNGRKVLNLDNDSIYSKLPDELKAVIIPTYPIVSSSGLDGVSNDVQSPGDYLYLLSTREINMAASDDNRKDTSLYTRTLDYYSSNSASINKYSTASKTSTVSWWLRSAYSNGSYPLYAYSAFYYINKSSSNIDYIGASASEALTPAFRVLD